MSERRLILKGASIIRRDGSVHGPCDIVISGGFVREVVYMAEAGRGRDAARLGETPSGAPGDAQSGASGETVDCAGLFVSPGLVNLHTHSPMTLFRGIAEDVSIDDWFNARVWPYESRLRPSDVRAGALLAMSEMIDSGVTAFFDHYFMADQIVSAAEEAGLRADIAPTVFGAGDWKREIDEACELVEDVNGRGGLVKARIGPHSPYICSPETLRACRDAAVQLGVGIHIHVSETEKQVRDSLALHGKTPFRVAYDAGLMDASAVFAHGTWMNEADARLVSKESFLAVAPKTYLKLASGIENMYRVLRHTGYCLHESPIKVGIGTDGAASSNTLSPLEQARLFALLGKDRSGDATAFALKDVWATLMTGHDALGARTGDVMPGFAADLIVWDLEFPDTWPASDPLAAIIYSAGSRNVRDVLVQGRFLKKGGAVTALDVREVMGAAARVRERLMEEGAGQARVKY